MPHLQRTQRPLSPTPSLLIISGFRVLQAYRKLALKLHPDKCKAPHAAEAFKAVSRAFSVLSASCAFTPRQPCLPFIALAHACSAALCVPPRGGTVCGCRVG